MANSLALLAEYNNSDSDSENEIPGPRVSVKRCRENDDSPRKFIKQTGR